MPAKLRHGAPGPHAFHLCVDMQRMFAEPGPWHMPWMDRIRPVVRKLVHARAEHTIFTRFIPAQHPGEDEGMWRHYYRRWASMTIERQGEEKTGLVPELAACVPPATIFDKRRYSPWTDEELHGLLRVRGADALIITGGETDVCVIATVLGAIDLGYRVIVVADALCSSSDAAHSAAMRIYSERFTEQVELADCDDLLAVWRGAAASPAPARPAAD
jgi:nicotinamidase-related amidase